MVTGKGSVNQKITRGDVQNLLSQDLGRLDLSGKKILVIIPDGTRTAPISMLFTTLCNILTRSAKLLDFLIALGTHPVMPEGEIEKLVGMDAQERFQRFPNVSIFNHLWDVPNELETVGVISSLDMEFLSGGLLTNQVPVRLNRRIHEYDQIIICGPVFPHEVAGFSGGNKYIVPGIAGQEIIDVTHWLGALVTNMEVIGVKYTPVRRIIDKAASMIQTPVLCITFCMKGNDLHGLFIGSSEEAWSEAADLSSRINIVRVPHSYERVLSLPSSRYNDLWTAAKAMYKTEPIISEGGEIIIYAPQIEVISFTHQETIQQLGYHVRDYFLKQWDLYKEYSGAVLAHCTHLRGVGTYEYGVERPRINVTLSTGISRETCKEVNLGYRDPNEIDPQYWQGSEDENRLVVQNAGEYLYKVVDVVAP